MKKDNCRLQSERKAEAELFSDEPREIVFRQTQKRLSQHIGQQLKDARMNKHWSQQQLGECIGIKKGQVSKIERGLSNPTLRTLIRMFGALDMKIKISIIPFVEKDYKINNKTPSHSHEYCH